MLILLKKIFNIGINENIETELKKRIALTNQIALLTFTTTVIYFFIFIFLKFYFLSTLMILFSVIFLFTFLLNHFKYFTISRLNLILSNFIGIILLSTAFGKEAGVQITLCAFVVWPLMLFENNKKKLISLFVLMPIVALLFLQFINYRLLPRYYTTHNIMNFFEITMLFFTVYLIYFSVKFLYSAEKKAFELDLLNKDLQNKLKLKDAEINTLKKVMVTLNHEINSPLTGMYISISLLKKGVSATEQTKLLSLLDEVAKKIHELIKKLTEVSDGHRSWKEIEYVSGDMMLDVE